MKKEEVFMTPWNGFLAFRRLKSLLAILLGIDTNTISIFKYWMSCKRKALNGICNRAAEGCVSAVTLNSFLPLEFYVAIWNFIPKIKTLFLDFMKDFIMFLLD